MYILSHKKSQDKNHLPAKGGPLNMALPEHPYNIYEPPFHPPASGAP